MASATYRKFARILSSGIVITLVVGFTVSLSQAEEPVIKVPLGLPPIEFPEDNPPTAEKIALGKQLYFDKRLSRDNTISCASCHSPVKGCDRLQRPEGGPQFTHSDQRRLQQISFLGRPCRIAGRTGAGADRESH